MVLLCVAGIGICLLLHLAAWLGLTFPAGLGPLVPLAILACITGAIRWSLASRAGAHRGRYKTSFGMQVESNFWIFRLLPRWIMVTYPLLLGYLFLLGGPFTPENPAILETGFPALFFLLGMGLHLMANRAVRLEAAEAGGASTSWRCGRCHSLVTDSLQCDCGGALMGGEGEVG